MQAIILAGGLGTRLRPLTETVPKPLIPILDRALVEYTMDSVPSKVIKKVIMTVSYKADELREYFESRDTGHYEVIVVEEKTPRGTGGAMRNVMKHIDGTFLAFNGDVVCSLDVGKMLEFHHRKRGIGTIALWKVDDVSRYGSVELDEHQRIHQFKEKVPKAKAPSDLINAGVYVLEPDIFDYMDDGKVISIERDVFPCVIKRGLYGYEFRGFWVDAGTPASLLEAQSHVFRSKGSSIACSSMENVKVKDPVQVSKGCVVEKGSELGPNVFLGKDVKVGRDSIVMNSIVYDGCRLGPGAVILNSIIGGGTNVEASARVEGKVLGENSVQKA